MKVAVVGGGSTYTPELVDGFARLRDLLPVEELVLADPDRRAARASSAESGPSGSWPTQGIPAGWSPDDRPRRRRWTAPTSVLLQLRVGGQAARNVDETFPLECGCVGQETTGAGGLAKALRTVPVVLDIAERVRAPGRARRLDRRLHQPGRDRHPGAAGRRATGRSACATWPSASSAGSPSTSASTRAGSTSTTSGSTTSPGNAPGACRRRRRAAGAAGRRTPTSSPTRSGLPLDLLRAGWASCRPTTCATSTRTTPWSPSSRRRRRGPQEVAAIERQLLELYADPALDDEAGAARAARRRATTPRPRSTWWPRWSADRGDVQVVNVRNDGTLPFLDDERGDRGARPGRRHRGDRACRSEPLDPLFAGLVAHVVGVRAARARRRGARRARTVCTAPCSRTR